MGLKTSFLTSFAQAKKSRALKTSFFLALTLLVATWTAFFWKLLPLAGADGPIAVHYSVLVGIDKYLSWYWTLVSPMLGTGAFIMNTLITIVIWRREPPLALLVALAAVMIQALFFISTFLVVLLNVPV